MADDLGTEPAHQPQRRDQGAAGGQHVVDDEHPGARLQGVTVHLDGRLAVLQGVRRLLGRAGQLAGLAHGHDARSRRVADRRGEQETPGLDPDHRVEGRRTGDQRVDRGAERRTVGQQRSDVLEQREPMNDEVNAAVSASAALPCCAIG